MELDRDKIPVSDAENIQMQAAGRVDTENNSALLIVRTGNEWQAHAYYPVTFEKRGGAYVLTHVAKAMPQAGVDGCYGCFWRDGYVLLTGQRGLPGDTDCLRIGRGTDSARDFPALCPL